MGVFPEPAPCADDVCCLVPDETLLDTDADLRPTRSRLGTRHIHHTLRYRAVVTLVAGLLVGAALPQSAFAPAASAHDRIDFSARAAASLTDAVDGGQPETWEGVPVVEQNPPTLALIETDLATLPQAHGSAGGEVLRFGDVDVPRSLVETILRASEATGVDPVYMMALADKESRFSTTVKASTSSAEGLFQFLSGTWLELVRHYGGRHGLDAEAAAVTGRGSAITVSDDATRTRILRLRHDPYVAALMAGELIRRDRDRIARRIGRTLKTSELYLAHFLGTASAGRFLTLTQEKPDQVARQAFRSAARANRTLFTQKDGRGRRALTVTELRDRLDGMIDQRLNRYEGVAALAALPEPAAPAKPKAQIIQVMEALP